MKILLVSPEYPPYHIGGGGVVVQNLAHTFSGKGHEVTVVSGYYPTQSLFQRITSISEGGVKVFRLPLLPTPRLSFQLKTVLPPNIFSLVFLFKLFANNQFDVINIHGYGHLLNDCVALVGRSLRKRYIASVHGIAKQPRRQSGVLGAIFAMYRWTLGRVFLDWASLITTVSKHTAVDTMAHGGDLKKIVIIPNGVDSKAFTSPDASCLSAIRRRYKLEKKDVVLGVGRLSEAKGFQFLVSAMPRIVKEAPSAYLLIAGADGGYRNELIKIVEDLGLNGCVKLIGEVKEDVKRALYSIAKVVVIPSIVEPFGMVALEAMSAGKPIVASDVEGLSEILRDERSSLCVPPGDSEKIAEHVVAALSSSRLSKALARFLSKTAALYCWEGVGELYIKAYLSMK